MHHQLLIANMPTKVGVAYTDLGYVLTLQFCDYYSHTVCSARNSHSASHCLQGEGLEMRLCQLHCEVATSD